MFNPNLKERSPDKLVYSTPIAFRIIFAVIAVVIFISVVSATEGPFLSRFNAFSGAIILICIGAALYLERWTFDRRENLFERNVGIYFWYSRKKMTLDNLEKVMLREIGVKRNSTDNPKGMGMGLLTRVARRTAMLCIEDKTSQVYKLDIVKGGAINEARNTAEKLAAFCDVVLEDDLGDLSGRVHF